MSCFLLNAFALCLPAHAAPQQPAKGQRENDLDDYIKKLNSIVDVAQKACLSNNSTRQAQSVFLDFRAIIGRFSSATTVEEKTDTIRGAAQNLPADAQLIENDKIRNCINEHIAPIMALVAPTYRSPSAKALWPDPIGVRFNFIRTASGNSRIYNVDSLILNLQMQRGPWYRRLALQDPYGARYFQADIGYPADGERISGTMVAEVREARLTSAPPVLTNVCFQRPPRNPSAQSIDYELFECAEGKACLLSARAVGWLNACPSKPAAQATRSLVPSAYAANQSAPYWNVPSLAALAERNVEGVGYTVFTVETNAFRHAEVAGVELDLAVNGIPVRENGLPGELRPIANDPSVSFIHRFALQTLDFQGADAGCDHIDLEMRPVQNGGRKGMARKSRLTYVALRDVAPRTVRLEDAELKWSAAYITPKREWRNIAEVHSYIYSVSDPATKKRAVDQAEADKRWLDSQALSYQGQKVVGVIRPPRTVNADGTAAFGLGAGLIQESNQVRFTFSEKEAANLAAFLITQRSRGTDAKRIVHSAPYIFQAVGGAHTAPGVCGS